MAEAVCPSRPSLPQTHYHLCNGLYRTVSLDIVLSVFLPVPVVLLPIDFVDFRHDSAVQSSLTALAAPII